MRKIAKSATDSEEAAALNDVRFHSTRMIEEETVDVPVAIYNT